MDACAHYTTPTPTRIKRKPLATPCVRSALWPFDKHEDKDKATAAVVVVVVVAVEVVVAAKVKAKDNGIGEGKLKRTTLRRPSSLPPCLVPIAGQNTTCQTRPGKRALTLVKKIKGRKVKAKKERTRRKEARKEKKKDLEEKQMQEKRTKEKEAKEKVMTKESLSKKTALNLCRKESGEKNRKRILKLKRQAKNVKDFLEGPFLVFVHNQQVSGLLE